MRKRKDAVGPICEPSFHVPICCQVRRMHELLLYVAKPGTFKQHYFILLIFRTSIVSAFFFNVAFVQQSRFLKLIKYESSYTITSLNTNTNTNTNTRVIYILLFERRGWVELDCQIAKLIGCYSASNWSNFGGNCCNFGATLVAIW